MTTIKRCKKHSKHIFLTETRVRFMRPYLSRCESHRWGE